MPFPLLLPSRPMGLRILLVAPFIWCCISVVSAQHLTYSILKGDNVVGRIAVARSGNADHASYRISSYAEIDMLLKQVVRSATSAEYLNGTMVACNTMMRLNNNLRDSSNMSTRAGVSHCYVHPDASFDRTASARWTTARMYFEEPVDQAFIFVESVLQDCPLRKTGPNSYTLTFPNNNENRYVYRDGLLQEVHVDRLFFDLVFRRT